MRLNSPSALQCPYCQHKMLHRTLLSMNTFGAKRWSDGKIESDGAPEIPILTRCAACSKVFLITTAQKHEASDDDKKRYSYIQHPDISEYLQAIQEYLFSSPEEEQLLHVKLMLKFNDRVRNNTKLYADATEQKMWEDNLRWLLHKNSDNPELQWLCAEINRNLGDFERSMELLEKIPFPSNLMWLKIRLKGECERKNTLVIELSL
jgi:hypothetical protein